MMETICTLVLMGMLAVFLALSGYIIIVGDREEAAMKKAKREKLKNPNKNHNNNKII